MTQQTIVDFTPVVEQMTQAWLAGLDNMYKMQEQGEKMLVQMIEQNRIAREEGRRLTEKFLHQVAENQKMMASMMETTSQATTNAMRTASRVVTPPVVTK